MGKYSADQRRRCLKRTSMGQRPSCHEPSHGLAPLLMAEVQQAFRGINGLGVSVLLIGQAVAGALRIVTRAFVMESGRTVLSGSAEALSADAAVRRTYLGV